MTMTAPTTQQTLPDHEFELKPRRHPVQLAFGILIALAVIALAISLLVNDNLQWDVVVKYLFDTHVLRGIGVTLLLTVICQVIAMVIGVALAVMKLSDSRILRGICDGYLWFFRGTPLLVQLIFWYNLAALFPSIFLGVPFTDLGTMLSTNALISGFTAAVLGFSLHEGAYMAEIVRAGIMSVSGGQREAALSTGMNEGMAMRRIILPQAMRVIVPPMGNETIAMFKDTSLLVALPLAGEMLFQLRSIGTNYYKMIPVYMAACLYYLITTSLMMWGQSWLEKRFGRGYAPLSYTGTDH